MNEISGAQISKKSIYSICDYSVYNNVNLWDHDKVYIPAGEYSCVDQLAREIIDPASFRYVENQDCPVWRCFTAPIEVLGTTNGLLVSK